MKQAAISRKPCIWPLAGAFFLLAAGCFAVSTQPASAEPLSVSQSSTASPAFVDIEGDEWFAPAVRALAAAGIIQSQPDGSFGPYESVSRAEIAAVLARALDLPYSPRLPFVDVKASDSFAGAVASLYEEGLVELTNSLYFSPSQPISREEATSLVMRSLDYFLRKASPSAVQTVSNMPFVDRQGTDNTSLVDEQPAQVDLTLADDEVSLWLAGIRDRPLIAPLYTNAVANAYRLGILSVPTDGWFFPQSNLTRAQMAAMVYHAFLLPLTTASTPPPEVPAASIYPSQSSGDEGNVVAFLESRLSALGYPCGSLDGVYDHCTRDAVMAFQKVERLRRDGKAGPAVWERLLVARTPTPAKLAYGTRCEVDLTRQVLFMITDNKVWKTVHVSSGKAGTRTGHFTIGTKYEGWVKCVTVNGRMYYPSYVVSRTAIHGYVSVPPYPASHGCVRVPVWTAEELYYQLPKGTVVDIYY